MWWHPPTFEGPTVPPGPFPVGVWLFPTIDGRDANHGVEVRPAANAAVDAMRRRLATREPRFWTAHLPSPSFREATRIAPRGPMTKHVPVPERP